MNERRSDAWSPTTPARARTVPPSIRAASVAATAGTGAGAGLALAGRPLAQTGSALADGTPWAALPLDVLLSSVCAVALAACCVWLLTVTVATALEAVTGVSSALLRTLTPYAVRRGVLLACGVAVGSTAVVGPAMAATEAGPGAGLGGSAATVLKLDGLPLPDRTLGDLREPADHGVLRAVPGRPGPRADSGSHSGPHSGTLSDTGTAARPGADSDEAHPAGAPSRALSLPPSARLRVATATTREARVRGRYQVRRGDSLWSIARRLRPGAALGEVDRTWRRVYRANRPEIGDDPDLLIPGTTLRLPVRLTGARRLDGPSGPGPLPHRKDAS